MSRRLALSAGFFGIALALVQLTSTPASAEQLQQGNCGTITWMDGSQEHAFDMGAGCFYYAPNGYHGGFLPGSCGGYHFPCQ